MEEGSKGWWFCSGYLWGWGRSGHGRSRSWSKRCTGQASPPPLPEHNTRSWWAAGEGAVPSDQECYRDYKVWMERKTKLWVWLWLATIPLRTHVRWANNKTSSPLTQPTPPLSCFWHLLPPTLACLFQLFANICILIEHIYVQTKVPFPLLGMRVYLQLNTTPEYLRFSTRQSRWTFPFSNKESMIALKIIPKCLCTLSFMIKQNISMFRSLTNSELNKFAEQFAHDVNKKNLVEVYRNNKMAKKLFRSTWTYSNFLHNRLPAQQIGVKTGLLLFMLRL
jgi:hypothetical protein